MNPFLLLFFFVFSPLGRFKCTTPLPLLSLLGLFFQLPPSSNPISSCCKSLKIRSKSMANPQIQPLPHFELRPWQHTLIFPISPSQSLDLSLSVCFSFLLSHTDIAFAHCHVHIASAPLKRLYIKRLSSYMYSRVRTHL